MECVYDLSAAIPMLEYKVLFPLPEDPCPPRPQLLRLTEDELAVHNLTEAEQAWCGFVQSHANACTSPPSTSRPPLSPPPPYKRPRGCKWAGKPSRRLCGLRGTTRKTKAKTKKQSASITTNQRLANMTDEQLAEFGITAPRGSRARRAFIRALAVGRDVQCAAPTPPTSPVRPQDGDEEAIIVCGNSSSSSSDSDSSSGSNSSDDSSSDSGSDDKTIPYVDLEYTDIEELLQMTTESMSGSDNEDNAKQASSM